MNVVLIGMPGCGKSTVGVLLAKSSLMDFVDTDLLIQRKYKMSLCQLICKYGICRFKEIENSVIAGAKFDNCVVATGGSAVYGEEAMRSLRSNGVIVYLKLSPEDISDRIKNIKTRGIAMEENTSINDLYIERAPLYEKYADCIIDCTGLSVEECVCEVKNKVFDRRF